MQPFPHHYEVTAIAVPDGDVHLGIEDVPPLATTTPREFDGPGGRWSPEALLVGAVADCFILTFRAIAKASRLSWLSLDCDVTGTLDRVDRVTQFTRFDMRAHLVVPAGEDTDRARLALDRAERGCLISSSLKAPVGLDATVEMAQPAELKLPA
jgi:organic hydroperoxide reductase OsmC/OhrA